MAGGGTAAVEEGVPTVARRRVAAATAARRVPRMVDGKVGGEEKRGLARGRESWKEKRGLSRGVDTEEWKQGRGRGGLDQRTVAAWVRRV